MLLERERKKKEVSKREDKEVRGGHKEVARRNKGNLVRNGSTKLNSETQKACDYEPVLDVKRRGTN